MDVRLVVSGLPELYRVLKEFSPQVAKEFRDRARGIVGEIVKEARANAGWSRRIPGAIVPTITRAGIGVRVVKKRAPHGPLYERGSTGAPNAVRHPLFGNREIWFSEPTRPFLKPAVDQKQDAAIAALLEAVETAKRGAGLE